MSRNMEYETFTTAMTIKPKGEMIFSEMATTIEIEDEAGGCFVVVKQEGKIHEPGLNQIAIDPQEWPTLKDAIERMLEVCHVIDDTNKE